MFILVVIFFLLFLILFLIFYNHNFFFFMNMNNLIDLNMNFNKMELYFSLVVLMISMMVIFYSKIYFHFLLFSSYKINLMIFILSMIILINSSSIMMLMLGWEGLGISSFLLISFYSNLESSLSSLITFFFNRLGDGFMIIFLSLNIKYNLNMFCMKIGFLVFMLMFIASITKSAQIPFGVWLPMAMSAPTPISSLVHSSTLVTAGIFMIMKFPLIFFMLEISKFIMFFGLITFVISGLFSFFIIDIKKAIAFSTLSQLGMIMFSLSLGNIMISFFHLIFHAFFKSSLFMNLGIFMLFSNSNQDLRSMNFFSKNYVMYISFIICCLNLMGLVFTSGFISKDLILIFFLNNTMKYILLILFYIGCIMTICYSLKFMLSILSYNMVNMSLSKLIKTNIFFVGFKVFSLLCIFIPLLLFDFFVFDLDYFLEINFKSMFFFIIVFSIVLIKMIFNKMKNFIFFFSSMLMILDFKNSKMNKNFLKLSNKFFIFMFLEEFSQMNMMLNLMNYKTNNLSLMYLFNSNMFFLLMVIMLIYIMSMNFH